jgi:hypothetical protein
MGGLARESHPRGNVMSDNADFKNLVRRRMAATGEKYTQAHRALINAARREVLPMSGRVILPRIAARYADNPAEPVRVFVEISGIFDLEMDEPEVAEYLAADEDGRDVIMMNFVSERITDWAEDSGELMIDHAVIYADQSEDSNARYAADDMGISPDQYVWLRDRLTDDEFFTLDDDGLHRLLTDEYTQYPAAGDD